MVRHVSFLQLCLVTFLATKVIVAEIPPRYLHFPSPQSGKNFIRFMTHIPGKYECFVEDYHITSEGYSYNVDIK